MNNPQGYAHTPKLMLAKTVEHALLTGKEIEMSKGTPEFQAALKASEARFELVEIARKDKPDVEFTGRLLGSVESRQFTRSADKQRDRWTRFEVWETKAGNWVVANIGCSDKPQEIDIGDCIVVKAKYPSRGAPPFEPDVSREDMIKAAMEFFGWTWLAKNLAVEMDWDVVERIA